MVHSKNSETIYVFARQLTVAGTPTVAIFNFVCAVKIFCLSDSWHEEYRRLPLRGGGIALFPVLPSCAIPARYLAWQNNLHTKRAANNHENCKIQVFLCML